MMKNVDIDIYMNQFINFFENNPNDLIELIGDSLKETFYDKVRMRCVENLNNGEDVSLTNKQMMEIVLELRHEETIDEEKIKKLFKSTKYGTFCLN